MVIDAGHGGLDPGASGLFSLKEKNLTLDLAKRSRQFLKQFGFDAYLTRNNDKDLTLLERSEFANALKADLFVSIHVNSAGLAEHANGIETYYLDHKNSFGSMVRQGYFIFLNKKDAELTKFVNNFFDKKNSDSKKLASCIHSSIINFLSKKSLRITDRGIKQSLCRIFLRNEIPTTLVEVGFLTNKNEARRLSDYRYRNMLAYAIGAGIKDFIEKN